MLKFQTLKDSLKSRWYLYLLGFLAITAYFIRLITPSIGPSNTLIEWQGLLPGSSSTTDIYARLGAPIESYEIDGGKIELYRGTYELLPNETYTKNNVLQKIVIRDMNTVPEETAAFLQNPSSSPELIRYVEGYETGYKLLVYASKGIAALKHDKGEIVQVWKFTPMSTDQFLQTVGNETASQPGIDHPFLDEATP